jgi:hypothetical protein
MSRAPQVKALPQAPEVEPAQLGGFTPRRLIERLFSVAGPKLAEADLLLIVGAGAEYAELVAGNAAHVADGVACLVNHEAAEHGNTGSGAFRTGESVSALLWHMQAHLESMEAMASAIGWAADELRSRRMP